MCRYAWPIKVILILIPCMQLRQFVLGERAQPINGVFTPQVFSLFKSNSVWFSLFVQFIGVGVNTVITLRCEPKQLHQDPLKELVLVQFQMTVGM